MVNTQGSLNSELFLKVDQSFLNKILNRIQRANPDASINDYLKTMRIFISKTMNSILPH